MHRAATLASLTALAGTLTATTVPAQAAVRVCRAPVASELGRAATEVQARRLALDSWKSRAAASGGKPYDSWRVATGKTVKCAREAGGQFACVALGTPCTIQQNPGRLRPPRPKAGGPISI